MANNSTKELWKASRMLRSISITHMRVQERGERSKDLGLGRGELFRRDYIFIRSIYSETKGRRCEGQSGINIV